MKKIIIAVVLCGLVVVGLSILGFVGRYVGEAVEVAVEETSPRAVQEKYEWFKRTKAALDAKVADIEVFKTRIEGIKRDYPDPLDRPRDVRQNMNQWRTEIAGVIASYNQLASRYNAQHAMWNYRFADFGKLPSGVADTIPRTFGEYRYTF